MSELLARIYFRDCETGGDTYVDITAEKLAIAADYIPAFAPLALITRMEVHYPIMDAVMDVLELEDRPEEAYDYDTNILTLTGEQAIAVAEEMIESQADFVNYGIEDILGDPTERGFQRGKFTDRYGAACSIQDSSLADEAAIWLGVDDVKPQIMASDARKLGIPTGGATCGWIPYNIPDQVLLSSRMHLTRRQVRALLPLLHRFAETGSIGE